MKSLGTQLLSAITPSRKRLVNTDRNVVGRGDPNPHLVGDPYSKAVEQMGRFVDDVLPLLS